MWCVKCINENMEDYIYGPFKNKQEATKFAKDIKRKYHRGYGCECYELLNPNFEEVA